MDSHKSIQATLDTFVSAIERNQDAEGLSVRLLKLLTVVLQQWAEDKASENLNALTDAELLQKLAISGSIAGALSTRETRKHARRAAAKIEFFEGLKEFGGVLKSQGVASVLGVTRQTINNHIKKGLLIAIQEGNDYLYPAFQFVGNEKLPYLEEILGLLRNVSAEAQCTFFLNPIPVKNGKAELPYVLLRDGATEKQLSAIKREAALFMGSTPS